MLKSLINTALRNAGYQFNRLPEREVRMRRQSVLEFGPYRIRTNNKGLFDAYSHPETNQVITRLVAALTKCGPVAMIDVGANCGDTAALAKCGGPAAILCVEGDPSLCASLRANAAQFEDVAVRQVFLGETAGGMDVSMEMAGSNNMLSVRGNASKQTIVLDTLDRLVQDWPQAANLRFIKCDTEGFDVRILLGGRQTLVQRQPALLFEYNRGAMDQTDEPGLRIFSFLKEIGYDQFLVYDNMGRYVCAATLENMDFIRDLHDYADNSDGMINYYDFLVFSRKDGEFGQHFLESERRHRRTPA
jgi:FkbM family methyltransferase